MPLLKSWLSTVVGGKLTVLVRFTVFDVEQTLLELLDAVTPCGAVATATTTFALSLPQLFVAVIVYVPAAAPVTLTEALVAFGENVPVPAHE